MAQTADFFTFFGFVVLTSANTFAVRLSRTQSDSQYSTSLLLLLVDILKVTVCWFAMGDKRRVTCRLRVSTALPGILYTWQTQLLLYSATYLEATVYQVLGQVKIATAAFFCWFILGKTYRPSQILSLFGLMLGTAMVQASHKPVHLLALTHAQHAPAVLAVLTAAVSSGYAGVLVEKLLKDQGNSFLSVNIEFALSSAIISFTQFCVFDLSRVSYRACGLFCSFNWFTCLVVVLQIASGLLVGLLLKFTDSVVKTFAVCCSLLLTCVVDLTLGADLPLILTSGLCTTLASMLLYAEVEKSVVLFIFLISFVFVDLFR